MTNELLIIENSSDSTFIRIAATEAKADEIRIGSMLTTQPTQDLQPQHSNVTDTQLQNMYRHASIIDCGEGAHGLEGCEKPWGREEWLVVTDKYCLKRLYINKDHKLSLQYEVKRKLCSLRMACDLVLNGKTRLMMTGKPYTINPKDVHHLIAHRIQ